MHDFGYLHKSEPESTTLTSRYIPDHSGYYTLEIRNYRPNNGSDNDLWNFLDCVTLAPFHPMLSSDGETFSSTYGTELTLDLDAGPVFAHKVYCLLTGISGTYPGWNERGIDIPLNYDPLVDLSLLNPGSWGSGFIGFLDEYGQASASLYWKPQVGQLGMTLYFAYVALPPGKLYPVLAASNPVNATVVKYQ